MDEITFTILKVVVSVVAALVTAYLIPYIKARTSQATQEQVTGMVNTAVRAAEQTLKDGSVKKDQVVSDMARWLSDKGIKMEASQLDALIEAMVYQLKQEKTEISGANGGMRVTVNDTVKLRGGT